MRIIVSKETVKIGVTLSVSADEVFVGLVKRRLMRANIRPIVR